MRHFNHFVVFIIFVVFCISCDNNISQNENNGIPDKDTPKDIPIENFDILIDDIIFIDNEYNLIINFFPTDTTEKDLIYLSSNEDVLTITDAGKILPKNKGISEITVKSSNRNIEKKKFISVYKLIMKPTIINTSENWGPFEKIEGLQEIGISQNVIITINNNTIINSITIFLQGKILTNNCDNNSTIFNNVTIKPDNSYSQLTNSYSEYEIYLDNIRGNNLSIGYQSYSYCKPGKIINSILTNFTIRSNYLDYRSESNMFNISRNIFYGNSFFEIPYLYYGFDPIYIVNNYFTGNITIDGGIPKYSNGIYEYSSCFKNNTIVIKNNSFKWIYSRNQTPDIDLSNNYWSTSEISEIDEYIIDANDSLSIDYYVKYLPILSGKHELTPDLN